MKKSLITSILLLVFFSTTDAYPQDMATTKISYCVDPDWAPYESIENNQHIGISKQYLTLIEQRSSLRFTFVPTQTWAQTLSFIRNGKCQVIPLLNSSIERKQFLSFSDAYFHAPNALYGHYDQVMVGNLSSITKQSVAVVDGYRMHQYLTRKFPEMKLITVENEKAGLIKVANQQVDYFVGSFYSANKIIQQHALAQLRIVGIAELEDKLRMGVAKESSELLPYINQAIAQLTSEDHNKVFSYLKMANLVKQTNYAVVFKTAIFFTLLILILSAAYIRSVKYSKVLAAKNQILKNLYQQLDQKNQELAEISIRDPLTQLYNRSHLAEIIEQQIRLKHRYSTTACLLMIDIDDFKQINDNFGHKTGDDILKQFAKILSHCARDSDIVARWGGEEFVLLCPETEPDEAMVIAKRFQQALVEAHKDDFPVVTCSIGIAELDSKTTAEQWFVSADNAMYYAKDKGKNTVHCLER
ncbi:diguanylate cyclase [Thalassotalea insulae]|uniref:diguanylate cyclase n=1 Tax=Thalassotalea insulae TaxID=2056778 RepID=A0ABQ6GP86_9GAMM|nr:diguanylate cyclase [Thalassotalea insulae]GLX77696.1 diguanylate cyclase [Thalassotalea insulae]